MVPPTG